MTRGHSEACLNTGGDSLSGIHVVVSAADVEHCGSGTVVEVVVGKVFTTGHHTGCRGRTVLDVTLDDGHLLVAVDKGVVDAHLLKYAGIDTGHTETNTVKYQGIIILVGSGSGELDCLLARAEAHERQAENIEFRTLCVDSRHKVLTVIEIDDKHFHYVEVEHTAGV